MNISSNDLLIVLSEALDIVEQEVLKVSDYHTKRVAWLSGEMSRLANLDESEISSIIVGALLHDNALNAMRMDYENGKLKPEATGERHCIAGLKNAELVFTDTLIKECILYHHECANGKGPFGKKAKEIHIGAEMVHIADTIDLEFSLGEISPQKLEAIENYLTEQEDILFSSQVIQLFMTVLKSSIDAISNQNISQLELKYSPIPLSTNRGIAELFAHIIDYKSPFTKVHSMGVATKAERMGQYYKYNQNHCNNLYIAGALHDIGKLFVSNAVLEKNGRLDEIEYKHIQSHAFQTYRLLSKIKGFDDIRDWASYHHEKLNGKGYPFGLTANEMTKEMRLLACIDIYQALTEERPYKTGMTHNQAIHILNELVDKGELDGSIVEDMNTVLNPGESSEQVEYTALFQCSICGYIFEGNAIPYDYHCPVCNKEAHYFKRMN